MIILKWYSIVIITLFNIIGFIFIIVDNKTEVAPGIIILIPVMIYLWLTI